MGTFRVEIEADGPHGCDREIGDGHQVYGCGRLGCADCIIREALERIRTKAQAQVRSARIVHAPGSSSEVVDDLVTGTRRGTFPPAR